MLTALVFFRPFDSFTNEKSNSIDKIKNASIVELSAVSGIGKVLAEKIYNYFHNQKDNN